MSTKSGRTVKKGIICRQGAALLRSLLYNCAKSAKRYNAACKEAKDKPHKVAMPLCISSSDKYSLWLKADKPIVNDCHITYPAT
ncbi:transposase [Rhodoflexus caldus]|uniref:transposase n=1 Tax=Rhodoflexus caldus TaxID=2891236 RepID=UPI00374CCE35